ncbi:MAG: hypothetical protein JWO84_520 [Parcubacteria group bacterium]|nr:hypothetical protein [Parcubacteria group bacterium]
MAEQYIAAVRGTSKAGHFEGVIAWHTWTSKEDFDTFIASQNGGMEVVEEGITEARGIELEQSTALRTVAARVLTQFNIQPLA